MNRPTTGRDQIIFDRRPIADGVPMNHVYILTLTLSPDARRRLGSPAPFILPLPQNWRFEHSPNEDVNAPWLVAPFSANGSAHDGHIVNSRWEVIVGRVNMGEGTAFTPEELEAAIRRELETQLANTV